MIETTSPLPLSPCLASDFTKWVVCNFQMSLHYWGWGYIYLTI